MLPLAFKSHSGQEPMVTVDRFEAAHAPYISTTC